MKATVPRPTRDTVARSRRTSNVSFGCRIDVAAIAPIGAISKL
jgi:hypothetical protein